MDSPSGPTASKPFNSAINWSNNISHRPGTTTDVMLRCGGDGGREGNVRVVVMMVVSVNGREREVIVVMVVAGLK